jgi:hypothetical protein
VSIASARPGTSSGGRPGTSSKGPAGGRANFKQAPGSAVPGGTGGGKGPKVLSLAKGGKGPRGKGKTDHLGRRLPPTLPPTPLEQEQAAVRMAEAAAMMVAVTRIQVSACEQVQTLPVDFQ